MLFGTCRLNSISNHNNLNNLINYSHSTKEVIQYINYLKGDLYIPEPYNKICFRTGICENKCIPHTSLYYQKFMDTELCIIEICSTKKYIHNDWYLHHLSVDPRIDDHRHKTPRDILDNFRIEHQSDSEIESDILQIQQMLYPKKIIIVSHYNSKMNGEYIHARNQLIMLLDTICNKYNIPFINPTTVLSKYSQEDVMIKDLSHYTDLGINAFSDYVNNFVTEEPFNLPPFVNLEESISISESPTESVEPSTTLPISTINMVQPTSHSVARMRYPIYTHKSVRRFPKYLHFV